MYENNKHIGWKKKENSSSNGSYDDSLIKNQISILNNKIDEEIEEVNSQLKHNTDDLSQRCVNAKSFGAKGDGVTDDSEILNSLLSQGLNIYLPAGTYLIENKLTNGKGSRIIGAGYNKTVLLSNVENDACIEILGTNTTSLGNKGSGGIEKVSFKRTDANNNATPIIIGGMNNYFKDFIIEEFNLGIVTSIYACYYANIENGYILNKGETICECGLWLGSVSDRNMSANANTVINVSIVGKFNYNLKMHGNSNTFIGGDISDSSQNNVSKICHVSFDGTSNVVLNSYLENINNLAFNFSSNASACKIDCYCSWRCLSYSEVANIPNGYNCNYVTINSKGGNFLSVIGRAFGNNIFDLNGTIETVNGVTGFSNSENTTNFEWYFGGLGTATSTDSTISDTGEYYRGKKIYRLTFGETNLKHSVYIRIKNLNGTMLRCRLYTRNNTNDIYKISENATGLISKSGISDVWQVLDGVFNVSSDNFIFPILKKQTNTGTSGEYIDFILPDIEIFTT